MSTNLNFVVFFGDRNCVKTTEMIELYLKCAYLSRGYGIKKAFGSPPMKIRVLE